MSKPESERPPKGTLGGYGFDIFMIFTSHTFLVYRSLVFNHFFKKYLKIMKNLLVANWKMNPLNLAEAKKLFDGIKGNPDVEIVICPPFVYLADRDIISARCRDNISVGAQDCSWEEKGAYTGDVSAKMLKNLGVKYIILGHSERRKYHNETHVVINKKIEAAQKVGLKVILCIENIAQLKKSLDFKNLIVAYEPTFAIGTGNALNIDRAKRSLSLIQKNLKEKAPVLYGGSTNSKNAKSYIDEAGFNGLLVGGASLDAKEFNRMIDEVK